MNSVGSAGRRIDQREEGLMPAAWSSVNNAGARFAGVGPVMNGGCSGKLANGLDCWMQPPWPGDNPLACEKPADDPLRFRYYLPLLPSPVPLLHGLESRTYPRAWEVHASF